MADEERDVVKEALRVAKITEPSVIPMHLIPFLKHIRDEGADSCMMADLTFLADMPWREEELLGHLIERLEKLS